MYVALFKELITDTYYQNPYSMSPLHQETSTPSCQANSQQTHP